MYKTVLRPVVKYTSKVWMFTKQLKRFLNTWERKILRKIYRQTKVENSCRIKTNYSREPDFVSAMGVHQMGQERLLRKIMEGSPSDKRGSSRTRLRWQEDVEANLWLLTDRRRASEDHSDWSRVIKEIKVLHRPYRRS